MKHADAFTLAIDLSGRLSPGEDQTQSVHGSKLRRYLMVATYTLPVDGAGIPLVTPPGEDVELDPIPQDHQLPPLDAQWNEETGEIIQEDPGEEVRDAEPDPLRSEEPEVDNNNVPDENVMRAAQTMWTTWHKLVEHASDVTTRTITFVEPIESRQAQRILPGLVRVYARVRALGLPLYRVHCDRAKELDICEEMAAGPGCDPNSHQW